LLLGAAALRAAPAWAQPGTQPPHPRVVLLAITEEDPLAARLAAELEALGLDVSRAQIDPTLPIEELVRMALTGGARGVVVADGRRTEFWVAEEGSDRIAIRQELEIEHSPAMESVLSLRTVEFLRVSLGLTGHSVAPRPRNVPPKKPRREPEKRVAFGLMSGVVASTGRLAPFPTVGAGLRVRVVGPAGIELRGLLPILTQKFDSADGPVDTSVSLVGGGLVLAPRLEGRVGFDVGAGAMATIVRAVGTVAPEGQTASGVGVALYGRAAARIRLSPGWSVRLDATGGTTALRRPVLVANDGALTPWGVAFVAALAGIDLSF
jgi:hypothetical protein